jgi:hypothetical protein
MVFVTSLSDFWQCSRPAVQASIRHASSHLWENVFAIAANLLVC